MRIEITGPKWLVNLVWLCAFKVYIWWWNRQLHRDIEYIKRADPDDAARILTVWRWDAHRISQKRPEWKPLYDMVMHLTELNEQRKPK